LLRVEGEGSRVEGPGSRVEGRRSTVDGRRTDGAQKKRRLGKPASWLPDERVIEVFVYSARKPPVAGWR
jgi:hypothetical protein